MWLLPAYHQRQVDALHQRQLWDGGDGGAFGAGASGLGLAIAKAVVELHGGTISAQSVSGQGTTVTVILPVGTVAPPMLPG